MKRYYLIKNLGLLLVAILMIGCATFRSGVEGRYGYEPIKNFNAKRVDVGFIISHYRQVQGLDVIPKLEKNHERIQGFDDIFIDALKELSNIKSYATHTNYSSDVNDPKRRVLKDSIIRSNDYIFEIQILRQRSFSKNFFGMIGSVISATVLPIPYKLNYSFTVDVYDSKYSLIKSYSRKASVTRWVETLFIFLYPFYPENRKKEELYVDCLHDIFKQIESEKILK
jgi:hypothetical protein